MSDFGELLKKLRKAAKLTQEQLGSRLHVSKSMVCYYERLTGPPSADILIQVADVFHVSVDYLLGREKKEQTLNLDGLCNKDIEFVQDVVKFLQGKNDGHSQNKDEKPIQKKVGDPGQEENEERDKDTTANCR